MTFKILLTIQTVNTIDWIFKIKHINEKLLGSFMDCMCKNNTKNVTQNSWTGHNKQSVVA